MRRFSAALRWQRLLLGLVPLAVVGLVLALGAPALTGVHPHLSKQSVIGAALQGYDRNKFPRVEAKLMHRRDLQRAASEWSAGSPDELIWVVAVSGNYGIGPSFACCSVPSDYPGHNTWGLAIFVDGGGPAHANEFEGSYRRDWPPFFDGLPDLAAS